jgi:hypothetical protein
VAVITPGAGVGAPARRAADPELVERRAVDSWKVYGESFRIG